MCTAIDNSSFASYSQNHHSSAANGASCHAAAFQQNAARTQQCTVTSYTQQTFSRSSNGKTSTKCSTTTFKQTSSKGGAKQPSGACGAHSQQATRNACHSRNDKRNGCHTDATKNKTHCASQRPGNFPCGNTQANSNSKPSHNHNGGKQQSAWSSTQQNGNQATIDLGNYTLDLKKSNSSMLMTNKATGDTTTIWGDPHIDTNGTSAMFKGPLTFDLPDKTKVTVGTQASGSVSYADQLTITQGNRAYVVSGLSQIDSNPLTVQTSGNGRRLDRMTPDGYTLVANSTGIGWIDPLTGRAPTAADFSNA